jgi:hypothetical protein
MTNNQRNILVLPIAIFIRLPVKATLGLLFTIVHAAVWLLNKLSDITDHIPGLRK